MTSTAGYDDSGSLSIVVSDRRVLDAIVESAAEYPTAADALLHAVHYFVRSQTHQEIKDALVRSRLVNHASNDLHELILGSLHGSGRSMLRTARSLFEAAVGARDIPASAELTERYLAHDRATDALAFDLDRLADFTDASPKATRHARHKSMRTADSALEAGVKRWGMTWRTNWAGKTVRDRAYDVGLGRDYETFYRFASQPTHAAAGGVYGTQRPIDGYSVIRFGPALAACPIALIYGLDYFQIVLDEFGPRPETDPTRDALGAVRKQIRPDIAAVMELDSRLWPTDGYIPGYVTVAYITPWKTSWYLHDPVLSKVILAEEPATMSAKQRALVDKTSREARAIPVEAFTEPITIGLLGVHTVPKPDGEWIQDTFRLPSKSFWLDPDDVPSASPLPEPPSVPPTP